VLKWRKRTSLFSRENIMQRRCRDSVSSWNDSCVTPTHATASQHPRPAVSHQRFTFYALEADRDKDP
jgi:hypothetical protein